MTTDLIGAVCDGVDNIVGLVEEYWIHSIIVLVLVIILLVLKFVFKVI